MTDSPPSPVRLELLAVSLGVAVCKGAPESPTVAHLRVPDLMRGIGQQRNVLFEQRGRLEVMVPRERSDHDIVIPLLDVREVGDSADVDEHRRGREAELHERQERMPSRYQLGLVSVLGERARSPLRPSRHVRSRMRRGS